MRKDFPIESVGGMPVLTDELGWKMGVPLFVAGRMAALRLGPGAGNLEGARGGAERIAWGIEDVLEGVEREERARRKSVVANASGRGEVEGQESAVDEGLTEGESQDDESEDDGDAEYCYHAGIGSRYASLGDDDGDGDGDENDSVRGPSPAILHEEVALRGDEDDEAQRRQIPRLVAGLSLS